MSITSQLNIDDLKCEFTNFLRVKLTDPKNRITWVTQYFNGDGTTIIFTPKNMLKTSMV
jgi:hypothetical protein